MDRYTIGIILRPHGVRGALKIEPLTDDVARFKSLKQVYIDSTIYNVSSSQVSSSGVFLTFDEIKDRNQAELYRNKEIQIDKKDAVPLQKGRYFIVDIIGCEVFAGDEKVGVITDVLQNGAADVYVIKSNGKIIMVPALKKLLVDVDCDNKKIIVDKQVFDEVVVYED